VARCSSLSIGALPSISANSPLATKQWLPCEYIEVVRCSSLSISSQHIEVVRCAFLGQGFTLVEAIGSHQWAHALLV
jgi:hypothetical protein